VAFENVHDPVEEGGRFEKFGSFGFDAADVR